jgi:hypothetical protein
MCGSNPELSPEVNSAKCLAGAVLAFGVITLLGFGIPPGGIVSALGGLLSLIAGSIICCCGPKARGEGNGQLMAGAVLAILGGVFHAIGAILCIVFIILANVATASATSDDGITNMCGDRCEQSVATYSDSECQSMFMQSCSDYVATCKSQCAAGVDACNNDPDCADGLDGVQTTAQAATVVLTLALGVPTLIFSCIAFGLEIAMAVKCLKGRKANMAEGATVTGAKQ